MFENIDIDLILRLSAFCAIFVIMVSWEVLLPRRLNAKRCLRWSNNLSIFTLNLVMLMVLPFSAVYASFIAIQQQFGLFFWVEFPFWPKVIICVIVLDFLIYWQHRIFHNYRPLWKLHRVHHTDIEFDVTTALRFHPIEIALSVLIKMAAIILLGAPVFAVIMFEIVLNSAAMFSHSNVRLLPIMDKLLRFIIVTPDMHRVHHSVYFKEHNSNYGFCLSIWDKLFGSYVTQPKEPHESMQIGLDKFNSDRENWFDKLLIQPFKN